jgi:glucuronate isomerase
MVFYNFNACTRDKFLHWANTLPKTIGNPLYLWSALELKRLFDVDEMLSADNAERVWEHCNQLLRREEFGAASVLRRLGAEVLVTSDDLLDDLGEHRKATASQEIRVLPSLRGDSMIDFASPGHMDWFQKLVDTSGADINTLEEYKVAILSEFERFEQAAGSLSDHALDGDFEFMVSDESEDSRAFKLWRRDGVLDARAHVVLKNYLLHRKY